MGGRSKDLYSFLQEKGLTPKPEDASSDADDAGGDPSADAGNATGTQDGLHFENDDVGDALHQMSERRLDGADFGIVRVDDEGIVEFYNRYESNLAGIDPEDAVGRNFFTELAPCSNNQLFWGRFKKGVRKGEMDERFTYTFTYKMRPTLVDVRLYRDEAGNNWVMIHKR
jgi:photoactive yellow protein